MKDDVFPTSGASRWTRCLDSSERGTQTERIASEWGDQITRREGRGNQKQTGIQGGKRSNLAAFHGQLEAHYYINFVSLSAGNKACINAQKLVKGLHLYKLWTTLSVISCVLFNLAWKQTPISFPLQYNPHIQTTISRSIL